LVFFQFDVKLQAYFEILPTFAVQAFLNQINKSGTAKENKHSSSIPGGSHLICMALLLYLPSSKSAKTVAKFYCLTTSNTLGYCFWILSSYNPTSGF
jgi:hypothetical protein